MNNKVYELNYDHYKQNILRMIEKDYPRVNYSEEQKARIERVIEEIRYSTSEHPIDVFHLLNNELWKKGVNAEGYISTEYKVHVRVIKQTSPGIELKVRSYLGKHYNPIKGQKNIGETDFDAAVREFYEETGLTLIFGLKENEPWDEHDGFVRIISPNGDELSNGTLQLETGLNGKDQIFKIGLDDTNYNNLRRYFLEQNGSNLHTNEVTAIYMKKYLKYKKKYVKLKK
jgi:ribosomal protein L31E